MTSTNFLGVLIEGPTRVGHYFRPVCTTANGTRAMVKTGPVLVPGKPVQWKFVYDPAANGGMGAARATLGEASVALNLKPERRKEGARFDRFGLVSVGPGGSLVKIYFDDLQYTAAEPLR